MEATTTSSSSISEVAKTLWELEAQACGATLSSTMPLNVAAYLRRAAELLRSEDSEDVAAGCEVSEQRYVLARCAAQCALQACEQMCRAPSRKKTKAEAAGALMLFTEALRASIDKLDRTVDWAAPPRPLARKKRPSSPERRPGKKVDRVAAERFLVLDETTRARRGYTSTYEAFAAFCGGGRCDAAACCRAENNASGLDQVILPRGAEVAREAAAVGELPSSARFLLESTAKALLSAAEGAVATKSRGTAARQFQRAALHLEILRLLGGRPLNAPLEESRRYARWRARHLSHVLENVVLEHGPEDPRTFEDVYERPPDEKVLGKGGYGIVFRARRRVDGVDFACKQLDLGRLSSSGLAQLHEEVNAMRRLDHPHICRLVEVFYSERRRCYLVMELCRGRELFDALDRKCAKAGRPVRVFSERRVAELARQMLGAVRYMHERGVAHRDVKLENWLFDIDDAEGSAHLKLVDFGLAKVFARQHSMRAPSDQSFEDRVGSAYYCAPEVLRGDYDKRCDLWSLGVIVYMLLCGAPPFWGANDKEILRRVRSHPLAFPDELWSGVSATAISFVSGLLERDVDRRFSAQRALSHDFVVARDSLATVAMEGVEWIGEQIDDYLQLTPQPTEPTLLDALRRFAKLDALEKLAVELAAALMPPERLVRLRDDFLLADKDGDGTLSFDELKGALLAEAKKAPTKSLVLSSSFSDVMMLGHQSHQQNELDSREIDNLFQAVNVDGTNRIGYREFAAAALSRRVDLDDQALHAAFDAIDSEGLGYITPQAVKATIGVDNLGDADLADIEQALRAADSDGDGRVDIVDFLDYIKSARIRKLQISADATTDTPAAL
ncbi:hypothetical protein CTAYLR_005615 [Chrysophaeum taylorii]|uniref:Calmodulin n=1 Tax=Chrysophaeum taylorii TaxID=2483200 RepID=A0AAD7U7W8_9STRA|nr:hypothetical protein CTAYLR_005615 [Chrysophaeum taylorii]